MKAITEVQKAIRTKARQKRISVKAVLEPLQERVGIVHTQKETRHHDVDALAASWSAAEGKAFQRAVVTARRIDEDLW